MKKEKRNSIEKKLNALLTVVVIICAVVCLSLCVQTIQGKQASIFGFRIYHILTGSMEPTIATGTNVIVHRVDPDTLEKDDIITFVSHDSAIYGSANTHRIYSIEKDENGEKYFVTKGDANKITDSVYVYPEDVIGKVVFHMQSAVFSNIWGFLKTPPGFITAIGMPLCLVCWLVMKDFQKEVSDIRKENENKDKIAEENKAEDKQ